MMFWQTECQGAYRYFRMIQPPGEELELDFRAGKGHPEAQGTARGFHMGRSALPHPPSGRQQAPVEDAHRIPVAGRKLRRKVKRLGRCLCLEALVQDAEGEEGGGHCYQLGGLFTLKL